MEGRLELLGTSLDELPANVSILDNEGTIIQTNRSWQEFGEHNNLQTEPDSVGVNYLEICEAAETESAKEAARCLSELLDGTRNQYQTTYPCHSPIEQRWFAMYAVSFEIEDSRYAIIAHFDITAYKQSEQEITRQYDRLAVQDHLNRAVRELTHAVIGRTTRPEIEANVCSVLAETAAYGCVWLGGADGRTDAVEVRASAGQCEDLSETSLSSASMRGHTIVRQAIWTRTLQTTTSIHDDSAFDWTDETDPRGYRSIAAVPVSHTETLYGVICLYTDRPDAFEPDEQEILTHIAEIVGHGIADCERKQALMNDELVEVEIRIADVFLTAEQPQPDWTVDITQTVAGTDEEYLIYGLTTPEDLDAITDVVAGIQDVELTVLSTDDETVRIVFRLFRQCVIPLLAEHGWSIKEAVFDTGDCYITAHLPIGDSIRQLIDVIRGTFPNAELLARRQVQSPPADSSVTIPETADLTERQRTILQTAYAAGYFEWPRDSSGAEIAETLGISPPTFHQHLRIGQQKLMDAVFEELSITA